MRKFPKTMGAFRATLALWLIVHGVPLVAFGQSLAESPAPQPQSSAVPDQSGWEGVRSSLGALIEEAEKSNPQIIAAKHGWAVPTVDPITTDQWPTTAKRPPDSRLDCSKLEAMFGVQLPPWQEGLGRTVDAIFAANATSAPQTTG